MNIRRQAIDSSPLGPSGPRSDPDCFACRNPQRHDVKHTCARRRPDPPTLVDRPFDFSRTREVPEVPRTREVRVSGASFFSPDSKLDNASVFSTLPARQAASTDQTHQTPLRTPARFGVSSPEDLRRGRHDRVEFEAQVEAKLESEFTRHLAEARERDRLEAANEKRVALE